MQLNSTVLYTDLNLRDFSVGNLQSSEAPFMDFQILFYINLISFRFVLNLMTKVKCGMLVQLLQLHGLVLMNCFDFKVYNQNWIFHLL
jgi:hypothetical protein